MHFFGRGDLMRKLLAALLSVVALSVGAVSAAEATPSSLVTIETEIDFSSFPFSGSFTVPVGSSTLGCSAGTFVDFPQGNGFIRRTFTCASGSESGETFIVHFHPLFLGFPGPGDLNGPWSAHGGTGDFAKLHGSGDFSIVFTGTLSGEETFTGGIHFD